MGSHASRRSPAAETTQVLDALRRLVRFLRMPSGGAQASGMSAAQFFVLAQLKDAPAPSIRALAERTMSDPSSVSVVVAKLEQQALIARAVDTADTRRAGLSLTPRGRKLLARAPELPQVRIITALAAMPRSRRASIARSLEYLVDAVGARAIQPRMFFEDGPKARKSRRHAR
jgi:DNA-binding MarR family transcriptional regulator